MHFEQTRFLKIMKTVYPDYFRNKKVLEVGSLDINGSIRSLYEDCEYIGIDIGWGLGVDLVCDASKLDWPDNIFDHVVSTECFEHNPNWIATFTNMHRMCKPNGLVLMTCASDPRPEHGTTKSGPQFSPFTAELFKDYYKNLSETDFYDNLNINDMFTKHQFYYHIHGDLYFWGIK